MGRSGGGRWEEGRGNDERRPEAGEGRGEDKTR